MKSVGGYKRWTAAESTEMSPLIHRLIIIRGTATGDKRDGRGSPEQLRLKIWKRRRKSSVSDNNIRAVAVRNGLRLCLRNKLRGLAVLDERKHFMDLMTNAFKTQGHTSLHSHIREIKMML